MNSSPLMDLRRTWGQYHIGHKCPFQLASRRRAALAGLPGLDIAGVLDQVTEERHRLVGVPLGGAYHAADLAALAIEDDGRRQAQHPQRARGLEAGIGEGLEVGDIEFIEEGLVDLGALAVLRDADDGELVAAEPRREAIERGHLAAARRAPRGEEVEHHHTALERPGAMLGPVRIDEDELGRWPRRVREGKVLHPPGQQLRRDPRGVRRGRKSKDGGDAKHARGSGDNRFHLFTSFLGVRRCPAMSKKQVAAASNRGAAENPSAEVMAEINASIGVDKRLYAQDISGSRAHCTMLIEQEIVAPEAGHAILKGLDAIESEMAGGTFAFDAALEDIHMNVEARLFELIGEDAGRLHTARSRNDQVATDLRLWVRDALDTLDARLTSLQMALIDQAEAQAATIMPGFTHLQTAQPVSFGHHMLAYVEMLERDRGRGRDCRARLNAACPLGAGALAGTSFPIDRDRTATALGFEAPARNSLDAVSDRDFALEFLAFAAICATHLSRLGEEIVLWSSQPFGFVTLDESFTTGSSMLPQKRNPDAAELVRAKTGRIVGGLTALLAVMKGLPLAYAKDTQEDKEPVFDAADTLGLCLLAMTGMIAGMRVDPEAMRRAATAGHATATDLADWLVRALDMPFRAAHRATARIVALAEAKGSTLDTLTLGELQTVESRITEDVFSVLGLEESIASRTSFGGTAPERVRAAAAQARTRCLAAERA